MSGGSIFHFSGRPDRQYLFAYATNMHPAQAAERCSRPACLGPAFLADHELGFFGHTDTWDGGQPTAAPAPGKTLWGVVYELSFGDAQRLDAWQDARLDGAGRYFHFPAEVRAGSGAVFSLLLYKKEIMGPPVPPSREMLDFIAEAARLRDLPPDYVRELSALPARPAGYPVPMRDGFLKDLRVVQSCADCDL